MINTSLFSDAGRVPRLSRPRRRLWPLLAAVLGLVAAFLASPLDEARAATPVTNITVNGDGGDRVYDGVGAILGSNARYLMDYPPQQRTEILNYLFKPNYGASLQLLKLEIGGDANSSDGAEASIEHTKGKIDCNAGYELSIAQQAQTINPNLRLVGLQWAAPGWVGNGSNTVFTSDDVQYLLDWLGCAKQHGLNIGYLGGWNESDTGGHESWYHSLRQALDSNGYGSVQIIAGDLYPTTAYDPWAYYADPDVQVLGPHDICGYPTGGAGAQTTCTSSAAAKNSGKPLWASELGAMDAGAQQGCTVPCSPAMDRAMVRGYIDARLTGYMEWPAIDAMSVNLPYENRGLFTADQPWSGTYNVNAMAWAIAHMTQFAWPPTAANPGGWKYIDSASGFLQGNRANGSFVTLLRSSRDQWSTVLEATSASADQQVHVTVANGNGIANKTVHVWASNFDFPTDSPNQWFVKQPDIQPVNGQFTMTVHRGWVYSLTTTTGQSHGANDTSEPAAPLKLPYSDDLATSGAAGTGDNQPQYLSALDGAFELAPCKVPDGSATTCTEQKASPTPVLWRPSNASTAVRYPHAVIGDNSWTNYSVSSDVLFTQASTTAGLIGRAGNLSQGQQNLGYFDGYMFDVSANGAWKLYSTKHGNPGTASTLSSGTLSTPPGTGSWHRLALTMSGSTITASVDGQQVTSVSNSNWTKGPAGIEAGAFAHTWPDVQYSHLSVTP